MQSPPPFQGKMVTQHPWALLENRAWLYRKVSQLEKLRWQGAQLEKLRLQHVLLCLAHVSTPPTEPCSRQFWFSLQELTPAISLLGLSGNFIPSALTSSPRVCALGYPKAQARAGSHHAALLPRQLCAGTSTSPTVPGFQLGCRPHVMKINLTHCQCILKGMRILSHSTVFSCGPKLMLRSHTSDKPWPAALRQELWAAGKEPLDLAQKENNLFSSRLPQKWVSRPDEQKTQVAIETRMPSTRRRNKCRPIFLLSWLLLWLLLPAAAQGSISNLQPFCPQLHQTLSPPPWECTHGHEGPRRDRDTTATEPARAVAGRAHMGSPPTTAAQAYPEQHLPQPSAGRLAGRAGGRVALKWNVCAGLFQPPLVYINSCFSSVKGWAPGGVQRHAGHPRVQSPLGCLKSSGYVTRAVSLNQPLLSCVPSSHAILGLHF